MNTNKIPKYSISITILVLTVAIIFSVFTIFIATSKTSAVLDDTIDESHGWSYQVLSNGECVDATLEFADEYTKSFSNPNITAVKESRVMTEPESDSTSFITLYQVGTGTEAFLDNRLIYSNIDITKRDQNGFLVVPDDYTDNSDNPTIDHTIIPLPSGFSGKTLSIISYYNSSSEFFVPASVLFGDYNDLYSPSITGAFIPITTIVICAIMALIMCIVLLVGVSSDKLNYKILFLIAFFIMLLFDNLYSSQLASSCKLGEVIDLSFLNLLYIAPLFFYIASTFTKWRKYTMFIVSGAVFLYYSIFAFTQRNMEFPDAPPDQYSVYFGVFVLSLVLAVIEALCNKKSFKKYLNIKYGILLILSIVVGLLINSFITDTSIDNIFGNLIGTAFSFNFMPICRAISIIFSIMAFVTIIIEFITDIVNYKKTISVLDERSKYAMQSYQMLLIGENETRAARHEMAHHMNALAAILDENDTQRAIEYIGSVTENLHNLPKLRYCNNLLINSVAGAYIEHARAEEIKMTYSINAPEKLGIDDKDLCVLIENMLDNAFEACQKGEKGSRLIDLNINYKNNFLYVGCVNSCFDDVKFDSENLPITSKEDVDNHGYGIAAMKVIAEKYNSILITEFSDGKFSIKTNLNCKKLKEDTDV